MTLWASPSRACPLVSRSRSSAGVRPGLAGRSVALPACTEGSGPCAPPSSRASPCYRMRDAELSACWTAACSMSACASRCRFRASGVEGAGMARSSVAAAMSFWLARGGVSGLSTLKSALMRSQACMPSSRARSPRRGFPRHGGAEQPHRPVLFRQLGLELACLGQLRVDIGPCWG
jgi:hypothetical protein